METVLEDWRKVLADLVESGDLPEGEVFTEGGLLFYRGSFPSDHGSWEFQLQGNPNRQEIVMTSWLGVAVPMSRRHAVNQVMHSMNRRQLNGAFILDMDAGGVELRSGLRTKGLTMTAGIWENVVYTNLAVMKQGMLRILAVAFHVFLADEDRRERDLAEELEEGL